MNLPAEVVRSILQQELSGMSTDDMLSTSGAEKEGETIGKGSSNVTSRAVRRATDSHDSDVSERPEGQRILAQGDEDSDETVRDNKDDTETKEEDTEDTADLDPAEM